MELGRPPPVWQSAVAYGETQVLNSNSTSAVQDPLSNVIFLLVQETNHKKIGGESFARWLISLVLEIEIVSTSTRELEIIEKF